MSDALFLSYIWPHSCLLLQLPHSGEWLSVSHLSYILKLFTPVWLLSFTDFVLSNLSSSPCCLIPSCGVLSRLRRMDPGAVPAQYSQLLDCICSWGQVTDILELITEWLTEALPKQGVSQYNITELETDRRG